jgi:nitrite reductase (NADH) large subunit
MQLASDMVRIVIIGASAAGHTLAVNLGEKEKDCSIDLISEEAYPFYDKRRLAKFLAGSLKEEDLFLVSESSYKEKDINFHKSNKVSLVNPVKKIVYFKDKATLEYDLLVIASGQRAVFPEISGIKKNGVLALYCLDDFKSLINRLIIDTVCLVGEDSIALECAEVIASKYNIEVKLISSHLLSGITSSRVEIINSCLSETIGEGGVQAVKLEDGRVIATSLVFFMRQAANLDFFKSTSLETSDGLILVDESGRTNLDGVFACGSACALRGHPAQAKSWDEVIKEGSLLAEMLAKTVKELRCRTL